MSKLKASNKKNRGSIKTNTNLIQLHIKIGWKERKKMPSNRVMQPYLLIATAVAMVSNVYIDRTPWQRQFAVA